MQRVELLLMDGDVLALISNDQVTARRFQEENIVGIRKLKDHERPLHARVSPSAERYHLQRYLRPFRHLGEVTDLTSHGGCTAHLATQRGLVQNEEELLEV